MDQNGLLLALWSAFALLTVGLLFLTYRFLHALRKPDRIRPKQADLLEGALKVQANRVQQAIDERDLSQEALLSLDETYRSIARIIPIGLLVFQRDGTIVLMNPALENMLPHSRKPIENIDQLPLDLVKEIKFFEDYPEVLEKRILFDWSTSPILTDLSLISLNNNWNLLTIQDKTRIVQLQKHVKVKNDLALMGELASGITHEVKNSLSIIQGHIQLLKRKADFKTHASMQTVEKEIQRLLRVTRQFMQSSKVPSLARRDIKLTQLVKHLSLKWKSAMEKGSLEIQQTDPIDLNIDPDQIKTVLDNLILNGLEACEYMDHGAKVKLKIRKGPQKGVIFDVLDLGPGISAEMKKNLFIPLVTSKAQGSGLGLFQARKIIQAHGGEIKLTQNPTIFSVWIPGQVNHDLRIVDDTLD